MKRLSQYLTSFIFTAVALLFLSGKTIDFTSPQVQSDIDLYRVDAFAIERANWDAFNIYFELCHRYEDRTVTPDRVFYQVKLENGHILYQGFNPLVEINDRVLAPNSNILIEAKAWIDDQTFERTATILSSPKKIDFDGAIEFPFKNNLFQARYDLTFNVLRADFDNQEEWEFATKINSLPCELTIQTPADSTLSLEIPTPNTSGVFDMHDYEGYHQFKNAITSQIVGGDKPSVDVKVRTKWYNETLEFYTTNQRTAES